MSSRTLILILTFITGFTGLVYEVTWHRYLSNLLGSQAEASAIILAVFLGGLSVGYALFGLVSRRLGGRALVQLCGSLEVVIGFWGVLFPQIYGWIWSGGRIAQVGFTYDILIAIALIGLPTILMGGTLPLLTQGLSKSVADSSVLHAQIYATNTTGAFVGALCGGFVLIPSYGLALTVLGMGTTNVIAGALILLVARSIEGSGGLVRVNAEESKERGSCIVPGEELPLWKALIIAFIAGFVSITLQTVFIRLTGISVGSSEYAFAMVVGVFISMLAFGAWITVKLPATYTVFTNSLLLFFGAVIAYSLGDCWPYGNHVIRVLFTNTIPTFYLFYLFTFVAIGIVLALPVGAMGSTMPLLFRSLRRTSGTLGGAVGLLYCVNTVGCVVGALLGGYASLTVFDLDEVFRICLFMIVVSSIVSAPLSSEGMVVGIRRVFTLVCMILLPLMVGPWSRERLAFGTFRSASPKPVSFAGPREFYKYFSADSKVVGYKDDPNTSVAIIEHPLDKADQEKFGVDHSLSLYVNGKSDGSNIGWDLRTTRLVGHIPALLSAFESPKVAVVGFGLGGTVGSLTLYPEVESVDVIEISPAVRSFSERFNQSNHGAAKSPKVKWNMGDAYRILGASKSKYSIIVSEPSNPWVAGVERLYAEEFYEIVRAKLTKRGLYGQWFHTYSISEKTFGLILNTFGSAFKYVRVFSFGPDLLLVGSSEPFDPEMPDRFKSRVRRPEIQGDLRLFGISEPEQLLALERWLDPKAFAEYGRHTLEFPKLAFEAGKDFFLQEDVNLEKLQNTPAWGALARERGRDSLLAQTMGLPLSDDVAMRYGEIACGVAPLRIYSGFPLAARSCRSILGKLLVTGKIGIGEGLLESDLQLLKYLSGEINSPPEPKTDSMADAVRASTLFGYFDSPLFELSLERLSLLVRPCFESDSNVAKACQETMKSVIQQAGR
jgi:spermidine synthase